MNLSETLRRIKKEKWTIKLATFSLTSLIAILTINYFREELFGIKKGYAPHNFAFNMTFLLPATFVILMTSTITIAGTLFNWRKWTGLKERLVPLLMTVPIIGLFLFQIWWILKK